MGVGQGVLVHFVDVLAAHHHFGYELVYLGAAESVGVEAAADDLRLAERVGGEVAFMADAVQRVAQPEHIDYLGRAGEKGTYTHGVLSCVPIHTPVGRLDSRESGNDENFWNGGGDHEGRPYSVAALLRVG